MCNATEEVMREGMVVLDGGENGEWKVERKIINKGLLVGIGAYDGLCNTSLDANMLDCTTTF